MRLLHIDHNLPYTRTLRGELLRHGAVLCELDAATDLDEARCWLAERSYDAVLLDPTSWNRDRLEVCAEISAAAVDTPVVILSVADDDTAVVTAIQAGAHDYLTKDEADGAWLMRRVRYAIERNRRQVADPRQSSAHRHSRSAVGARPVPHGIVPDSQTEMSSIATEPARPASLDLAASSGIGGDVRLLHVEDDPSFARMFAKLLSKTTAMEFRVDTAATLSEAVDRVRSREVDVVLLDLSLPDSQGLATLTDLLEYSGETPILVCTGRDDDATAIDGMSSGAEDFLIKTQAHLRYMPRAVQMAIARRNCQVESVEASERMAAVGTREERTHPEKPMSERRRHPRYVLTRPLFAVPVLPDASPAAGYSADGISVDVSEGGLRFEIANLDRLPTKQLLAGIEAADGVLHFATVTAVRVETTSRGLNIGARFTKGSRDLLRPENLHPTFNPETCCYETGLPSGTLDQWVDFGILRPTLVDRILLCPRCRAVPTFRQGCRVCGSVRLHSRPLIHHFACAHVGDVTDFEQGNAIRCPKCRTRNLIVGADYEYLNGPHRCLDCGWSDTELDLVAECLKCAFRFPFQQAVEEDLIGYDVDRLDPLALIDAG
jgi:DNA-binding response OmpR family regulator